MNYKSTNETTRINRPWPSWRQCALVVWIIDWIYSLQLCFLDGQIYHFLSFYTLSCNTLKFASHEIELKWFNLEFMCSWKHRKIKNFNNLKFIIRSSNMVVHTCRCIWFIWLSSLIKIQNGLNCFWGMSLKLALK